MKLLPRFTIKAAGESGQGVNSVGEIIAQSLKESGFYTFGYREYPSLIKGGYSCHQIDIDDQPLSAPSAECDVLVCLSRYSVYAYLPTVRVGGIIIHSLRQLEFNSQQQQLIQERQLKIEYVPAEMIAIESGGKSVMANMVMVGVAWQLLQLELDPLVKIIKREFAKKPQFIEANIACVSAGHRHQLAELKPVSLHISRSPERTNDAVLSGNMALAFGAVAAGVRAYYAYPMTPSSSLLSIFTNLYHDTGMLVKQVEDEISVAEMAIGSMFMGTRALVGTSGGGYDLMTESVSLAGMTETPFVCILGQRPGPATGLPTWTSTSDLNLAIYAGHGEYAKCVLAASDVASAYTLIQHAFNIAEKYQTPVIVLTEKEIAESLFQIDNLPADVPIERHLVPADQLEKLQSQDRFKVTESGISPRWLPGQSDATFDANGDEHLPDGSLTEEAEPVAAMYSKRLRKLDTLAAEVPGPVLHGPSTAALTFVGWGSVKNAVIDVLESWNRRYPAATINYLHFEYVFPLPVPKVVAALNACQRTVLIENNAFGQLGRLITQETTYTFGDQFLKFDGRPFFVEDVVAYLEKVLPHD